MEIPNIQNGQPFASSTAIGTSTGTAPNTASSVRDSLSSPKEVNSDANRIDELAKSSSSQSNSVEVEDENLSQDVKGKKEDDKKEVEKKEKVD